MLGIILSSAFPLMAKKWYVVAASRAFLSQNKVSEGKILKSNDVVTILDGGYLLIYNEKKSYYSEFSESGTFSIKEKNRVQLSYKLSFNQIDILRKEITNYYEYSRERISPLFYSPNHYRFCPNEYDQLFFHKNNHNSLIKLVFKTKEDEIVLKDTTKDTSYYLPKKVKEYDELLIIELIEYDNELVEYKDLTYLSHEDCKSTKSNPANYLFSGLILELNGREDIAYDFYKKAFDVSGELEIYRKILGLFQKRHNISD